MILGNICVITWIKGLTESVIFALFYLHVAGRSSENVLTVR